MPIQRRFTHAESMTHAIRTGHRAYRIMSAFMIGGIITLALSGCGQKGGLYIEEASSQAEQESTSMLEGQQQDDFQLPEPSDDPNDY